MPDNHSIDTNLSDISSLLSTIDELISVSGNKEDIDAKTISMSKQKAEDWKKEGFVDAQLDIIEKGIAAGLPIETYAKQCYNWMQMDEIRLGLLDHLDTSLYESSLFSASQMREIRLGLLDHLDVSSYASLVLSPTDMRKIRKALFANAYRADPSHFGKTIINSETGITLRISNDCLKAYVTLPEELSPEFTKDDLLNIMDSYEITYGIADKTIEELLNSRLTGKEICIAQGKAPRNGRDGWYEIFFENSLDKGFTVQPDYEIDYSDVNTIEAVESDTILAKYHPAQRDTEGVTVTGITIEGIPGSELPKLTGNGFRLDTETHTYTATQHGYASYDETTYSLNVWKVYHIQGDICYYQSLEYDGTVHISGSVRSTSVIKAAGDIIIDGFMENATVLSEQNVVIKGGANGGGQGKIEAGGSIRGNFFESIDLFARGMIEGNYFLNSNIETEDRLIARGRKARIIGGKIKAALGIDVVTVGNYLGGKTVFNVGDIHSFNKRITDLALDKKKIMEELEQLSMGKQKLVLLLGEEQAIGNTLYEKTCEAIRLKEQQADILSHEISRLQLVIQRAEKACIKIHGGLQSEVVFIINNIKKETPTPLNRSITLTRANCIKKK